MNINNNDYDNNGNDIDDDHDETNNTTKYNNHTLAMKSKLSMFLCYRTHASIFSISYFCFFEYDICV